MKLNMKSKLLLIIMAIVFVVFNVIFFLIADSVEDDINKLNASTIISWVFVVLGFASFLIFSYFNSKGNAGNVPVLRLTLIGHCTVYLIVDFILAAIFTLLGGFIKDFPIAWTVAIQLIALAVHLVIALLCLFAKETIENVEEKIKKKTAFMDMLRADAAMLPNYCTDAAAKPEFVKFAEAVRYSDPMSCEALEPIEEKLSLMVEEIKSQLIAGDIEGASANCKVATNVLRERNLKCKVLK